MKMKGYADYEECRLPWLGRYPRHWSLTKTKRVCSFTTGWTPPTGDSAAYEGDCPWANISDLGQRVILDTAKTISAKAAEDHGLELIPAGSLMFSFKLSVGQVAFAGKPMFSNEAIASFRESAELDLGFAYYAFPLFLIENAAENIYGAKLLNQFLIREAIFPLPPTPEQRVIATFLDRETAKIEALIAEQERLLSLLAEKRQAVTSHAVTKGLNPDAPMKDSGVEWLGEIPAHWSAVRLKYVASVQTGIAKGKDNAGKETITVPYLRVANVQDGYLALDDIAMIDIEPEQLKRYRLQPDDVLMNEGGDFDKLGRGAIWRGEVADCIHQNHVFAVRPHGISPDWLNCITGSTYAQFYFMGRSKQSTNLASISSTNIMELPVVVPPEHEQSMLLRFINKEQLRLDGLRKEVEHSLGLLRERRGALISAAVTGEIDVRELC